MPLQRTHTRLALIGSRKCTPHVPGAIPGCPWLHLGQQLQAHADDASLSAITQRQAAHYGLGRRVEKQRGAAKAAKAAASSLLEDPQAGKQRGLHSQASPPSISTRPWLQRGKKKEIWPCARSDLPSVGNGLNKQTWVSKNTEILFKNKQEINFAK